MPQAWRTERFFHPFRGAVGLGFLRITGMTRIDFFFEHFSFDSNHATPSNLADIWQINMKLFVLNLSGSDH